MRQPLLPCKRWNASRSRFSQARAAPTPDSSCLSSPTCTAARLRGSVFSFAEEVEEGRAVLLVTGCGAAATFAREAGGHRFQRVPPTERHGRRHSSTVTVSITHEDGGRVTGPALREVDLEESFCRGSGAGGQNRNKRDTCCVLRHVPTGLVVREESQRTQESNRRLARERLAGLLTEAARSRAAQSRAADLRAQRGSGERADKIRTYQLDRDRATDHRTGRECRWRDLATGNLALLS